MKKHSLVLSVITLALVSSLSLAQAEKKENHTPRLSLSGPVIAKNSIAEKIIGTWKLISIEDTRANRSENEYNPTGYIMYDSTGHMAVQITRRSDRAKFASEDITKVTTDEKAAAFSSYAAYYGTYTINEAAGTITHHVEGSWTPNDVGKNFVRYFKLFGNRVTLMPMESNERPGTLPSVRSLTWERVK